MTLALRSDEIGSWSILEYPLAQIRPAKVNDKIYRPVDPKDPSVINLAEQIRKYGQLEPIVISRDDVIVSGHRRRVASQLAGLLHVKVRRENISSTDPHFPNFLVVFNEQRVKSADEIFREQLVQIDVPDAHRRLIAHRTKAAKLDVKSMELEGTTRRSAITRAKWPFLDAIQKVINDRKKYWPLSDRGIHYGLLNNPPLIHASKAGSKYRNDLKSYKALIDLLTRARLTHEISWNAIADSTRPVSSWNVHSDVTSFIREELDNFLEGYWRDLQCSQPIHFEIVGEKNTVESIIRPVASEFTISYTIGRGYSSLPPRHQMAQRFKATGKDRLVLMFLSDFDPEGQDIPHSFARSMRDDFDLKNVEVIKVALTHEQVAQMNLPPQMKVKKSSSRSKKFRDKFGDDVFELEAVPPDRLQQILHDTITSVIDMKLFKQEQECEADDAARLAAWKQVVAKQVQECGSCE
jgi:hypothetical protein